MKKLIIFLILTLSMISSPAMVVKGMDGRWYGNICITQLGWQEVPWQIVGSMCFSPQWRMYGFIANA
jgi:hypothetical protein